MDQQNLPKMHLNDIKAFELWPSPLKFWFDDTRFFFHRVIRTFSLMFQSDKPANQTERTAEGTLKHSKSHCHVSNSSVY